MFLRFAAVACAVVATGLVCSPKPADAQGYPYVRGPAPAPQPYEYVPGGPEDDPEDSVVMIPGASGYPARPDGYIPPAPGFIYPDQEPAPYGGVPGRGSTIQRGDLPPPGVQPMQPAPGMQAAPGYSTAPMQPAPGMQSAPGYSYAPAPGAPIPPADINAPRPPAGVGANQNPQSIISTLPPEDQPEIGERKELPQHLRRQMVEFRTKEPAGTLIIDTANTYLYLVLGNGQAMRYGIGVGREGFTWAGTERISRMAEWPDWHPPEEMISRQPYLPRFMAGGESNPLGARALYLGKTLYRIHGTNQPSTIGTFVSSGCVRLTNEDIQDLYDRVKVGSRVVVLPGKPPATAQSVPPVPALPPATAEALPPQNIRTR